VKTSRFSEEQVLAILKEADKGETPVSAICKEHSISEATFYKWRKQFRGMDVNHLKEYRSLIQENARLKAIVADLTLKNHAIEEVLKKL
jgi:putative transposase